MRNEPYNTLVLIQYAQYVITGNILTYLEGDFSGALVGNSDGPLELEGLLVGCANNGERDKQININYPW